MFRILQRVCEIARGKDDNRDAPTFRRQALVSYANVIVSNLF